MADPLNSLQQLLTTNFGLSPSGYTGSRGDVGYVGSAGSSVSAGPKITAINYPGDDTAADTAGGTLMTLTGANFASGAMVVVNGSAASVVTVVSSSQIAFTAPANPTGSYILYVVNPDGATTIAVPGLQYSPIPVWTTPAGTLGTAPKNFSFSANVVATGDGTITYNVVSGTLPSGLTLNSNTGAISGTTPNISSLTTYSFTIRSTDAQRQDTDRAFSITVVAVVPPSSVEMLLVAGGGGGGGSLGAGGGAGGLLYYGTNATPKTPNGGVYSMTTGVTYSIVVGAGGATDNNGSNSTFSSDGTLVYSATGGGRGGTYPSQINGVSGGSGGGGGYINYGGISSGGSGTTGQGNAGGNGQGQNYSWGMCVGAGADIYAGKYVQQYECDDVSEFKFVMGNKL